MSSRNFIYGLYPELYNLPASTTLAITALAGQNAAILKYVSGGSLSILGTTATVGSSYAVDNRYPMGTGETVNLDLSGPVYVVALGATCVFSILRGRSAGF